MVSAPMKNMSGADVGTYEFDGAQLANRISKQLLHDVIVMYQANLRQGSAKTKTRGEVSGSTKKLFRQKGTGNARMGTKRSPIRRGGGHTFAKKPRDWSYRLPKKAIKIATRMALLSKFQDSEAIVLDNLALASIKTKTVTTMLKSLGVATQSTLIVTRNADQNVWMSARNISNVLVAPARQLNAYSLLRQRRLVITKDAMDAIRDGSLWASDAE